MATDVQAIHFRPAAPHDAAMFASLAETLFRDAFAATSDPVQLNAYCAGHFSEPVQLRELETPTMSVFFVEVAGRVAGYIQLEVMGDVAFLHRFYLGQTYHGSGIAQQMMEYCAGLARAAGVRCIRLTTWVENARAIAFYRKTGFDIVAEQPFVFGTEVQADYVLERPIAGT